MLAAAAYRRSFAMRISSMWEISVHSSNVGLSGPMLRENLGLLRCRISRYSLYIRSEWRSSGESFGRQLTGIIHELI